MQKLDELDHLISKVSDICFNHNSSLFHLITSSTLVLEPRIDDVYLPNVHKFFETSSSDGGSNSSIEIYKKKKKKKNNNLNSTQGTP